MCMIGLPIAIAHAEDERRLVYRSTLKVLSASRSLLSYLQRHQ